MGNKKFEVGKKYVVTVSEEKDCMDIETWEVPWSLRLGLNLAMAKSIRMLLEDEDADESFSEFLLDQMFIATTIVGDEKYLSDRMEVDKALLDRIREFAESFTDKKDAETVIKLAEGQEE